MKISIASFATLLITIFFIQTTNCSAKSLQIYGFGMYTCDAYITSLRETKLDNGINWKGVDYLGRSFGYKQWIFGFLSGNNFFGNNITIDNVDGIFVWINNYCENHPTELLANAVAELVSSLFRNEP
jgi:hypothetical protein